MRVLDWRKSRLVSWPVLCLLSHRELCSSYCQKCRLLFRLRFSCVPLRFWDPRSVHLGIESLHLRYLENHETRNQIVLLSSARETAKIRCLMRENSNDELGLQGHWPGLQDDVSVVVKNLLIQVSQSEISFHLAIDECGKYCWEVNGSLNLHLWVSPRWTHAEHGSLRSHLAMSVMTFLCAVTLASGDDIHCMKRGSYCVFWSTFVPRRYFQRPSILRKFLGQDSRPSLVKAWDQ